MNLSMRGWGVLFLILGIGSLILPYWNIQFKLLSLFNAEELLIVDSFLIVAGAGLVMVSFTDKKSQQPSDQEEPWRERP
jgi:hypothetical protein